jgi:hypothetical protein
MNSKPVNEFDGRAVQRTVLVEECREPHLTRAKPDAGPNVVTFSERTS